MNICVCTVYCVKCYSTNNLILTFSLPPSLSLSLSQIDDFLAGKAPLSVAIRLGESVVVVNLNRAKVEEVDVEPSQPEHKKRKSSSGNSRTHSTQQTCCSNPPSSSSDLSPTSPLNSNPHWSSTTSCPSVSPTVTPPCAVVPTVRSIVPVGAPAPSDDGGSSTQTLGKSLSPADLLIHEASALPTKRHRGRDMIDHSSSSLLPPPPPPPSSSLPPSGYSTSPLVNTSSPPCLSSSSSSSRPIKKAVRRSTSSRPSKTSGGGGGSNKLSRSQLAWEQLRQLNEEVPTSQNGVSMKRKAVMEAIGEILKKMYAQRVKGKVPGTFKGRFSSEFTCDSDMHDIIHSRTTMTSYGEMLMDGGSSKTMLKNSSNDTSNLSKTRFKENEELRDKVALLKWRMQQQKAMRGLKRRRTAEAEAGTPTGERDWPKEEGVECDVNGPPLKLRKKTGFCGLKRGFLLTD